MSPRTRFIALSAAVLLLAAVFPACSQKPAGQGAPGNGELSPRYSQESLMLEQAVRDDPQNPKLLIQLGNLYYDWGQQEASAEGQAAQPVDKWTKAVDCYGRALKIDPGNVNVRVDMANLMRFMGNTDEAISQYHEAIKTNPVHPQARINLILALGQSRQDYKGAIKEYEALLEAIPAQRDNTDLKHEVDGFREAMKEARK